MAKKRYALVGVGGRSREFITGLLDDHADTAELVACCDLCVETTAERLKPYTERGIDIKIYHADDFDTMVKECAIETVIVVTTDALHAHYICRAMELGCDTVTEKPLTTTVESCQRILDKQKETGKECRVGFNYRYSYGSTHIKHLLMSGVIGKIVSVNVIHGMGYEHGPFYFHRWHGESANSGGLLVHKVTHYFDLANWYLSDLPEKVYARGERNFFKKEYAEQLGITERAATCTDCPSADSCPFYLRRGDRGEGAEIEAIRGRESGYYRDQCVFRDSIDTPDTWHVMVNYRNGAVLNYSNVAFHSGKNGWFFRGTHGSMEVDGAKIHITPYYGDPYTVDMWTGEGSHGGGDPRMLADLYADKAEEDPYKRFASHHAGVWSVLVGIAAHHSIDNGEVISPKDLVTGLEDPEFPDMPKQPEGFTTADMRGWVNANKAAQEERRRKKQRSVEDTFGADG